MTVKAGASITIASSGDSTNNVWIAPAGQTTVPVVNGSTITKAANGISTTIIAPSAFGVYYVYVSDSAGNISAASTSSISVDTAAPKVISAVLNDVNSNAVADANDTLVITFNEPMDSAKADAIGSGSDFDNNEGLADYIFADINPTHQLGINNATDVTLAWNSAKTELTITLGAGATGLVVGTSLALNISKFTDVAGNGVDSNGMVVTATTQTVVRVQSMSPFNIEITLDKALTAEQATAANNLANYTIVNNGVPLIAPIATITATAGEKVIRIENIMPSLYMNNTIVINKAVLGTTADSAVLPFSW